MHVHRCMGTKTISLEDSAYERLKAAKRAGESFSDVVRRVLGAREPSLLDFTRLLDKRTADRLADAIERMRAEDLDVQRRRLASGR
jgi:predicted CopG family antitoxin